MKNIIAVIWDFDKTLVDGYMQDPIFKEYHVDASAFWREVKTDLLGLRLPPGVSERLSALDRGGGSGVDAPVV